MNYDTYASLKHLTGGDSGRVVIWNMEPIASPEAEIDENVPKILCQLDNHLGRRWT